MGRRAGWLLAAAVLVGSALPAGAAPQPHVVDPRGDWPVAAQDIVSATFSTVATREGRALEVRLQLAGPPAVDRWLYWEVAWSTPDCALNYIEYSRSAYWPGVEHAELIRQCEPGGPYTNGMPATGRLEGATLVLTTPLARRFPQGTLLSQPWAQSFGFVANPGGVPSWYRADVTDKGRPFRVGRG